jgi:hypothetical protein
MCEGGLLATEAVVMFRNVFYSLACDVHGVIWSRLDNSHPAVDTSL